VHKPKVFPKDKLLLHNPAPLVQDCVLPPPGSALHARRQSLAADLVACGIALTSAARAAIAAGVCFHHGGMGPDARRIVEAALRERVVTVLCCTTALAAGVNFPARRVIVAAPMVGLQPLTHEKFTQMCGRAGRYGYDSVGEAVLCCGAGADTAELGRQLVAMGSRTCVASVLALGLDRFLLEMICCCAARKRVAAEAAAGDSLIGDASLDELRSIAHMTLHARCLSAQHVSGSAAAEGAAIALDHAVTEQVQLLQTIGLVSIDDERRCVRPTAEGQAVFMSCISLAAAARLRRDVDVVGPGCGRDELQLLHMLVPPSSTLLPRFDWHAIHDSVWPTLGKTTAATAAALHVEERCLYLLAYTKGAAVSAEDELQMRRFVSACMLIEVLGGSIVAVTAARFHVEIGAVHALQEAACAHAVCISEYMSVCRLWGMHAMCSAAVQRMRSGGGSELQPLTVLRSCTAQRARALLLAGITCPLLVVQAGEAKVLAALARACGAQPNGIAGAIVQHAAFLIGQEVKLLQGRVRDLLRVRDL